MNNKGFTLIEMLIVLMVISILLLITIPNVTQHNNMINKKGCDAYISMVQAQMEAYEIDNGTKPTLEQLIEKNYIESTSCPNGAELEIDSEGNVIVSGSATP